MRPKLSSPNRRRRVSGFVVLIVVGVALIVLPAVGYIALQVAGQLVEVHCFIVHGWNSFWFSGEPRGRLWLPAKHLFLVAQEARQIEPAAVFEQLQMCLGLLAQAMQPDKTLGGIVVELIAGFVSR